LYLLRLVDLFKGVVEASMAFDGAPIGISDGLPKNRRFQSGLFPGLGLSRSG
jgi:hypothetical protein